jgi:hypothetical protein
VAVVHFNANLHRDVKEREKNRAERIKVVYLKFKNGEATVRNVKIKQDFGMFKSIITFMILCVMYST